MIIHYLECWDLSCHADGADFRPPGWDITVQEMVWRLKDQRPHPAEALEGTSLDQTMTDDLQDIEGPPSPEDEARTRKIREGETWLRELELSGWRRKGSGPGIELHDPQEPEASVFFNPYSGELLLSPKYIERIKAILPATPRAVE